ncbi:MAG: cytochrome c-type biogenesis protein [Burkholderiales bacterium]
MSARLTAFVPWIALAASVVFLMAALNIGSAAASELEFADRAEELRFRQLASELRCLVCQNQSLEDSHASLANDLKREVLTQMRSGASDERIVEYLVGRYGDFVRYRPPMNPGTWLLWLGPALLLAVGGFVAWKVVRRHGGPLPEPRSTAGATPSIAPVTPHPPPKSRGRRSNTR